MVFMHRLLSLKSLRPLIPLGAVGILSLTGITTQTTASAQLTAVSIPNIGVGSAPHWGTLVEQNATLSGTVTGGLAVGGRLTMHPKTSWWCTRTSCPPIPVAFNVVSQAYTIDATRWGALTPNMTQHSTPARVKLTGSSRTLDVARLTSVPTGSFSVTINAPATATVLIEVTPQAANFIGHLQATQLNGVHTDHLLWDFGSVTSLILGSQSFVGTVLAPQALVTLPALVAGDLFAKDLQSHQAVVIHDLTNGFTGSLPQYPITADRATVVIPNARASRSATTGGPAHITAP
jgi:hypothetical protein